MRPRMMTRPNGGGNGKGPWTSLIPIPAASLTPRAGLRSGKKSAEQGRVKSAHLAGADPTDRIAERRNGEERLLREGNKIRQALALISSGMLPQGRVIGGAIIPVPAGMVGKSRLAGTGKASGLPGTIPPRRKGRCNTLPIAKFVGNWSRETVQPCGNIKCSPASAWHTATQVAPQKGSHAGTAASCSLRGIPGLGSSTAGTARDGGRSQGAMIGHLGTQLSQGAMIGYLGKMKQKIGRGYSTADGRALAQ